jgi:U32 family peptidase
MSNTRIPELLSPAGDWECLRAAVANGADAVYFGLPQFNARHRATNFAPDELPRILGFLHDRNVKGFVALNTLIFSDELPAVADYVQAIANAGADAVIVQDFGLVRLVKQIAPDLPVHASTQMTLTEPRGIEFARRLGVERVVLARELSLDDIRKLTAATSMPVEVFVHGALCVAYSGQCLTSEALGGRSANRGQCAQACRLPYAMIVDGQARDLGDRAYLLSPQDLAAYDHVALLADAGAVSIKIEGRLKSSHYVAAATQTYRAAIDASAAQRQFAMSKAEERDLAQTFSRGFTPGFLEGVNHQRLVQGRVPKSRGVRLGKIVAKTRLGVKVRLDDRGPIDEIIKPGDGVVFDLGRPEEKEPGGRVWRVEIAKPLERRPALGEPLVVTLSFEANSIDLSATPIGCTVWKTDDPALRKRLEHSYAGDRPARRVPIRLTVSGRIGQPLRVAAADGDGHNAEVEWPGPLVEAHKHPLSRGALEEQFGRLGDTPFRLGEIGLDLPDAVMAPRSVLNDLRRQIVARLLEMRAVRREVVDAGVLVRMRAAIRNSASVSGPDDDRPHLNVLVRTLDQLDAVLAWQPEAPLRRVSMIYCDFEDVRRYREAVPRARAAGVPVGLASLRILKPGEEGFLKPILNAGPDAVLVRNFASLEFFREELPPAQRIGDFSLNVANEITAALMIEAGLAWLTPSYDLNWDQLSAMIGRSNPAWYETVIHQHMPMFHMEHCVFAAFLSTGKDFRDCGRPCDRHRVDLRDRAGANFPVIPDAGCRNTVFNSVPQSGAEYVSRMRDLGIRRFRVDLLRETPAQVARLLDCYARVIVGTDNGRTTWRELRAMNQLGVTRGTLSLV